MKSCLGLRFLVVASTLFLLSLEAGLSSALAVTLYIGDPDGFGFGDAAGLVNARGGPAERLDDGDNILGPGDGLPDLDLDGWVNARGGDNFDNRSAQERAGTNGEQFTDVSLSRTFRQGPGIAADAYFRFHFDVPDPGDPYYGVDHYVTMVYGDHETRNGPVRWSLEGNSRNLPGVDVRGGDLNGSILSATRSVPWELMTDGLVWINLNNREENYVAIDYVFLGADLPPGPGPGPGPDPIPEPGTLLLLSSGILGMGTLRRKRTKSNRL